MWGQFRVLRWILACPPIQLDEGCAQIFFQGFDAPLDLRMGRDGPNRREVVNKTGERDLTDLFQLGEERNARRIAKAIV